MHVGTQSPSASPLTLTVLDADSQMEPGPFLHPPPAAPWLVPTPVITQAVTESLVCPWCRVNSVETGKVRQSSVCAECAADGVSLELWGMKCPEHLKARCHLVLNTSFCGSHLPFFREREREREGHQINVESSVSCAQPLNKAPGKIAENQCCASLL